MLRGLVASTGSLQFHRLDIDLNTIRKVMPQGRRLRESLKVPSQCSRPQHSPLGYAAEIGPHCKGLDLSRSRFLVPGRCQTDKTNA